MYHLNTHIHRYVQDTTTLDASTEDVTTEDDTATTRNVTTPDTTTADTTTEAVKAFTEDINISTLESRIGGEVN